LRRRRLCVAARYVPRRVCRACASGRRPFVPTGGRSRGIPLPPLRRRLCGGCVRRARRSRPSVRVHGDTRWQSARAVADEAAAAGFRPRRSSVCAPIDATPHAVARWARVWACQRAGETAAAPTDGTRMSPTRVGATLPAGAASRRCPRGGGAEEDSVPVSRTQRGVRVGWLVGWCASGPYRVGTGSASGLYRAGVGSASGPY